MSELGLSTGYGLADEATTLAVTKAKVFCNTGCRRRREKGRRKRLQERLEPKWRTDYSLRVRTPHDLSVRVLWLEWQWPLPVAYALFLLA